MDRRDFVRLGMAAGALTGSAPALAVEFGRKVLYSTERPTFQELEESIKGKK